MTVSTRGRLLTRCEVDGRDVGAVRAGPVLEVDPLRIEQVLLHLRGGLGLGGDGVAADAGVVDQDAQALLAGLDLLDQLGDVLLAGDIESLEWDDLALDVLAVCLHDGVKLLCSAPCDVDLCNVSLWLMRCTSGSVEGRSLLTFAPLTARVWVIMRPMPLPPPVTRATRPFRLNRLLRLRSPWLAAATLLVAIVDVCAVGINRVARSG